jgi:hypothetical protein
LLLSAFAASPAAAAELELVGGLGGALTDWRGDAGVLGFLKTGLRFDRWISLYGLGRLGYGGVDQRLLTFVSLGVQVWPLGEIEGIEPFARLSFAHQHEEPIVVVRGDPISAILGIGDAIRHRGGLEAAIGIDLPIAVDEDGTRVFSTTELATTWWVDDRGPRWYWLINAGLGVDFDL